MSEKNQTCGLKNLPLHDVSLRVQVVCTDDNSAWPCAVCRRHNFGDGFSYFMRIGSIRSLEAVGNRLSNLSGIPATR